MLKLETSTSKSSFHGGGGYDFGLMGSRAENCQRLRSRCCLRVAIDGNEGSKNAITRNIIGLVTAVSPKKLQGAR